ncbi:hypothetical protein AVEN_196372-1 [Araneus ventricosus]|uniref:Uncharacterized protein n=1 Tax=Araneus ventricosus TaxID=182803 RepID=A0A4Y2AVJ0_ARAVE|nr:hypothetical protein AVEN_196372-1 [Araneus ventricosus]
MEINTLKSRTKLRLTFTVGTTAVTDNQKPVSPSPTGNLNDSRFNSSSAEGRHLVTNHLATARPLPKKVRIITGGETHLLVHMFRNMISPLAWEENENKIL